MKSRYGIGVLLGVLSISLVLGLAASASARRYRRPPWKPYAANGLYLGLAAVHSSIGGDFDGSKYLEGQNLFVLVPKLDKNLGFGLLFGGRSTYFGAEFSYLRSSHEASWAGVDLGVDADYNMVNVDGKLYLLPRSPLQVYLLAGFGFLWIDAPEVAVVNGDVGDVRFQDFGLNAGAGVAYYVSRKVAITGGCVYRSVSYEDLRGDPFATIEGGLDGSGMSFVVGMTFNLREE